MDASIGSQDVIRRFGSEIISTGVHIEELRHFWAKALGMSGPQWMIIMALADLGNDEGAPVNAVSRMLHVDASFVTTQSRLLEKKGFIRRKTSREDARVVSLSLTDKTRRHLAELASRQENLNEFVLAELPGRELES
jgi:MarR family transcriptional regulator, organic hydroperoxide resistance regulator